MGATSLRLSGRRLATRIVSRVPDVLKSGKAMPEAQISKHCSCLLASWLAVCQSEVAETPSAGSWQQGELDASCTETCEMEMPEAQVSMHHRHHKRHHKEGCRLMALEEGSSILPRGTVVRERWKRK